MPAISMRYTGPMFCLIVRNFYLDDDSFRAWRLLEGIEGMSDEQRRSIARGDVEMNEDMADLVPLNPQVRAEYQERFLFLYAGRTQIPGRVGWWKPVAYLSDLGPHDVDELSTNYYPPERSSHHRETHYADSTEVAVRTGHILRPDLPLSSIVYYAPCEAPPTWWWTENRLGDGRREDVILRTLKMALAAGHLLERRGHSVSYGHLSRQPAPGPTNRERKEIDQREAESELAYHAQQAEIAAGVARVRAQLDALPAGPESWREIAGPKGRVILVPRAAFEADVVLRTQRIIGRHPVKAVSWTPLSESGWKMGDDGAMHTDWVIGLRWKDTRAPLFPLPVEYYRAREAQSEIHACLGRAQQEVDQEYFPVPKVGDRVEVRFVHRDTGAPSVWEGVLVVPEPDVEATPGAILLVPDLGPAWYIPAATAGRKGLVLARVGGELAHLVTVARDHTGGFATLAVGLDTARLCEGLRVRVHLATRTIEVLS